jgi:hypothetical protein
MKTTKGTKEKKKVYGFQFAVYGKRKRGTTDFTD